MMTKPVYRPPLERTTRTRVYVCGSTANFLECCRVKSPRASEPPTPWHKKSVVNLHVGQFCLATELSPRKFFVLFFFGGVGGKNTTGMPLKYDFLFSGANHLFCSVLFLFCNWHKSRMKALIPRVEMRDTCTCKSSFLTQVCVYPRQPSFLNHALEIWRDKDEGDN